MNWIHMRLARHWRALFTGAILLLFVGLAFVHAHKVARNRSAFTRWQPQVLDLDRVDIAKEYNYPNPPIMAVLLEPFARMTPMSGALVWFGFKAVMALLCLAWLVRLMQTEGKPMPDWAIALAVLLSLKPIVDDLNHGNVNLFIAFLVVAAITAYRHRRDLLAGGVLGLAIACKVTPALFLPYLVWKRSWKTLAGCVAGLLLFLYPGFVPATRLGWDKNQQMLASWYDGMVRPFVVEGQVTSEHNNQSLPGLVARLLTERPSFSTYVNDVYTPTRYDNVFSLRDGEMKMLVKGCMALFALLVVWSCRTPGTEREGWRLGAECGIVVLGMLLFSERTWKHHAVTLMLPLTVVCYYLATETPGRAMKWYLTGSLVVVVAMMFVTSIGPAGEARTKEALVHSLGKQAQLYGAYVLAYLVLLVNMVTLLKQPRKPEQHEQSVPVPLAA